MLITGARPTAGEGAKTHARERHRSGVRSRQEQRKRNAAFIGYQEFTGPLHNIVLVTKHGSITIAPRSDISPITVAKVMSLAAHPKQQHGEVTRHEPVAPRWGTKGFGPPYALISGVFHSADEESPLEGNPIVLKGDVAMVPGTMTFVIALAEHPEWGNSHTVWGKVDVMDAESWGTLHKMPKEPYANRTDNGVTTRWLEPEAVTPFHVRLKPIVARQEVELAGSLMGLSAAGRQEA
ncbi:MAG: hypothetical protein J3K34DRAFT_441291 [Monoraphidium minutum]|nr:MAG: hypothetical protein J3K34DRAFT_441291 [Monoraphidium minutum]